jgi:hypothetical protein
MAVFFPLLAEICELKNNNNNARAFFCELAQMYVVFLLYLFLPLLSFNTTRILPAALLSSNRVRAR